MRAPAGHYIANGLMSHVVMAGTSICCLACSDQAKLPLPRDPRYSAAVEAYLERHRLCASTMSPIDPRLGGLRRGAA